MILNISKPIRSYTWTEKPNPSSKLHIKNLPELEMVKKVVQELWWGEHPMCTSLITWTSSCQPHPPTPSILKQSQGFVNSHVFKFSLNKVFYDAMLAELHRCNKAGLTCGICRLQLKSWCPDCLPNERMNDEYKNSPHEQQLGFWVLCFRDKSSIKQTNQFPTQICQALLFFLTNYF